MAIRGKGTKTYLFVNGLSVKQEISLRGGVVLMPAVCNPTPDDIIKTAENERALGVAALMLRSVSSQLKITAKTSKDLAIAAWNSRWDVILLNALLCTDSETILQSDTCAEDFSSKTELNVIHPHIHLPKSTYAISEEETLWLTKYYQAGYKLLDEEAFSTAVHSLATYTWHSLPRIQLAILWTGIEALFGVQNEIVFKLSLLISKYLEGNNTLESLNMYKKIKKLYVARSKAVHGSKIKDLSEDIDDTVKILNLLIKKCIMNNEIPPSAEEILFSR